jgi:hypothetical protein
MLRLMPFIRTLHLLARFVALSDRKTGPRGGHRSHSKLTLIPVGMLIGLICSAEAAELPLVQVVLSTSGLAQFTHSGPIVGGSTIDLAVRLDQVDDILKSLIVFDKEGAVGAVSLPGKAPLAELFRDLPFGPDALNSPTALLNALVGSEVEIAGQVTAKGRVFRVETEEVTLPNNNGHTNRHRLTLVTEKGLVQALLEEVTALRFTDAQANAQLDRALAGLTENRAKERRRVSIGFLGEGKRNVAISYVVAAPVWKTAYRLVLPKAGDKARLQGWAVVENLTGGDWKDVDLVLVSGNPVTMHQPLYTAFFSDRTEVPVLTAARVTPFTDDAQERPKVARPSPPGAASMPPSTRLLAAPAPPPMAGGRAMPVEAAAPAPEALAAVAHTAEAEEASTQLLYRFPASISLATGHTMMVPFVDREVSIARAWLYQPDTAARHPLAAVRVHNDGETGLPAGIVTAYDASAAGGMSFVGDAQLPLLTKGAPKFVTFALDSKTDIRREDRGVLRTTLGKAVNGVLTLTTRSRRTIAYEITPPPDEGREIIIEEPRLADWTPAAESKEVEETPTRLRYKVGAPKGQTTKATLALERVDSQTVALTDLAPEDILARIRGLQNESSAVRDAVAKLGAVVADMNKAKSQRSQLEAERRKIAEDQDRIRRNLESAGQASDLGRRYLDMLKTQEDRLAEINRVDQALEKEIAARRQSAEQLARQLTL